MLPFDAHERELWAGRASAYEGSFALLCAGAAERLLEAAGVGVGTRLLDVGTGPGTVGRLAAGMGAVVVAVDAEPSMVAAASRHLPDVRLGLLPDLPFADGEFDVAVANFVVNHVADPAAALAGMRRVVRPGGTVAVTIWTNPSVTQILFGEAIAAAGVAPVGMPRVDDEHDFPRTPDGLAAQLTAAGLTGVTATMVEWVHRVDPEVWWSGPAGGVGGAGHVLGLQTPETVAKIKQEYDRLATQQLSGTELALPATAVLASGRV